MKIRMCKIIRLGRMKNLMGLTRIQILKDFLNNMSVCVILHDFDITNFLNGSFVYTNNAKSFLIHYI